MRFLNWEGFRGRAFLESLIIILGAFLKLFLPSFPLPVFFALFLAVFRDFEAEMLFPAFLLSIIPLTSPFLFFLLPLFNNMKFFAVASVALFLLHLLGLPELTALFSALLFGDLFLLPPLLISFYLLFSSPVSVALRAVGVAFIVAYSAFLLRALDPKGVAVAIIIGASLFAFSPEVFFALLLFFLSASIFSSLPGAKKEKMRKARQVAANSFAALLFSALGSVPAALASIAAATADTWATELGKRFWKRPVDIATFEPKPRGESGAVSPVGLIATLLAPLFLYVFLSPFFHLGFKPLLIGAVVGSLTDSFLGALAQAKFLKASMVPTEKRKPVYRFFSGWKWLDNDAVNLLSFLFAGRVVL